jgi:SAM-dependent methyltransferase
LVQRYGEYPELCVLLNKYVKPKDEILVIGCGNSTLSASMYDVGYRFELKNTSTILSFNCVIDCCRNIKNIDTSSVVIKQMQAANARIRPDLIFEQRDALDTKYDDKQFSVVLDKGTLDALMPDNEEKTLEQINALFKVEFCPSDNFR